MATFPLAPLPTVSEFRIAGQWVDLSSRVRDSDADPGVTIVRGQSAESTRAQPSRLAMALDNRDIALSNRSPGALYYGQLGRNIKVRHRIRWTRDIFNRNVSSTWGTATSGEVWSSSGGSATDYSVNGTKGFHTLTSVNVMRNSTFPLASGTSDVVALVNVSATATGAALTGRVIVGTSGTNYYGARLDFMTDGSVTLSINKSIGGVGAIVKAAVAVGTYTPADQYWVRIQRHFGYLRAKAWPTTTNEPTAWTLVSNTPETEITSFTAAGCISRAEAGNTNVNPIVAYDTVEVNDYRFHGEVAAWPPVSNVSGSDVVIPIEAAGLLRRLGRSSRPLRSAMFRGIPLDNPLGWWPLELGPHSGLGGTAMTRVGQVNFGANGGHPGSAPLPDYTGGGKLVVALPDGASSSSWRAEFTARFGTGANSVADFTAAVDIKSPSGDVNVWEFFVTDAASIVGSKGAAFQWSNSSGSYTDLITTNALVDDGQWHHFRADVAQSGGNISVTFAVDGVTVGTKTLVGKTLNSTGSSAVINPLAEKAAHVGSVGQLTWYSPRTPTSIDTAVLATGNAGETAAARIQRLCGEESIAFELVGSAADTVTMGPQRIDTLLNNLYDCAATDLGLLYEPCDAFAIGYRTRRSLYNQTGPTLTYSAGQVAPPFTPVEDDQLTVNDAIARRPSGSFARVTVTSGPLSNQDPPNGAGTYDEDVTYNAADDGPLLGIAGYRAWLGTWDEFRVPQVTVNLGRLLIDGQVGLAGQVAGVDVGDYLAVGSTPAWLPPDAIELLAYGYTERQRGYEWTLAFNTRPAGPFTFGVVEDDVLGRADADGRSTTVGLFNAGVNASLTVATSSGPLWTTTGPFPFDIRVAGSVLRVTNITGASSPQTFTVSTTVVNGVTGTILAGRQVFLARPMRAGY